MKRLIPLLGLLLMTSAAAQTDCETVRTEKGSDAFEECRLKEEQKQIDDAIKKYEDLIKEQQEEIKEYYERIVREIEDLQIDLDRDLEKQEENADDLVKDLQREEEDANDRISVLKIRKDAIADVRKATKNYYKLRVKVLEEEEKLRDLQLDQDAARYELQLREQQLQSREYQLGRQIQGQWGGWY